MRSRSAEGTAWSDAGPQAGSQRQGRDRRAWLHAKPATRALRTRGPGPHQSAAGGRLRRARLGDLILDWGHGVSLPCADQTQQTPSDTPRELILAITAQPDGDPADGPRAP